MSVYSNWYPHDFDAGNDPKIIKLEMKHGLEGYGLYHRILEHMGTADNHSLCADEINFIAKKCFSTIENPAQVFFELGLFSKLKSGRFISDSLNKRLKALDEKRAKRVIAGRKGGKQKSSNAKAKLKVNYKQSSSSTLALENSTEEKRTEEKTNKKDSEEYEQFYAAYPKKKGREQGYKTWKKLGSKKPELSILLAALEKQKQSRDWQKDNGQYIPLPSSWLNGLRWDDELDAGEQPRKLNYLA